MEGWTLAHYYDGHSAARVAVHIELGESSARLLAASDGSQVAAWPYAALRVIAPAHKGQAGQFGHARDDEIRLSVPDAGMSAALVDRIGRHRPREPHGRRIAIIGGGIALAGALAAVLWLASGPLLDLVADAIPRSTEQRLGRAALGEFERLGKTCANRAGQAALDRLAERLVRAAGSDAAATVEVKRNANVNAFAVPGGHIVFLSGLIDKAESPDEVAGVLAHEMAHVELRHPTRLMLRHFGVSMLASLLLGDSRLTDAVGALGILAYSREFEAEADARGIEILRAAGIRTTGIVSFFTRLEAKEGRNSAVMRYLTSHPPTAERRALAERSAGSGNPAMSNEDWTSLRDLCKQG